jgi:hypothetical protein
VKFLRLFFRILTFLAVMAAFFLLPVMVDALERVGLLPEPVEQFMELESIWPGPYEEEDQGGLILELKPEIPPAEAFEWDGPTQDERQAGEIPLTGEQVEPPVDPADQSTATPFVEVTGQAGTDQMAASEKADEQDGASDRPSYFDYLEPNQPYQTAAKLPDLAEFETRQLDEDDHVYTGDPGEGGHASLEPLHPDLLLPDLITLPAYDFRLVHDANTGRLILRFSNSIVNQGPGPLELLGVLDQRDETVEVVQSMHLPDGGETYESPVGQFYYHDSHNHWHWDGFSLYEVYVVQDDGNLGEKVYTSGKVGYCVRDDRPASALWDEAYFGRPAPERDERRYSACDWRIQGLSPGWADIYLHNTPGQFVELTGLEDGVYALRSLTDPNNFLYETDKSNNETLTYFRLEGLQVEKVELQDMDE